MKKLLLVVMLVSGLFAWEDAKVKYVLDGDTLMLQQVKKKPFKVRLIALDTFETKFNHRVFKQLEILKNVHPNTRHTVKQVLALGFKAKDFVSKRYAGKDIKFYVYGEDQYKRKLVWIQGLNFALVRMGWATYYPNNKISKERKAYMLELSKDANLNKRGIYKRF